MPDLCGILLMFDWVELSGSIECNLIGWENLWVELILSKVCHQLAVNAVSSKLQGVKM